MRFLLMVKATPYSEAGVVHSKEHIDALYAYKMSLAEVGALLADEELQPSSNGIKVKYPKNEAKPQVQVGPFLINQDFIAKYTLIDVKSEEDALNWALKMPIPEGHGEFEIELRRIKENGESIKEPRIEALEADLQDQLNMLKEL
ncbi:YciI family protein [Bacillus sp. FJAT-49736]|uniref:YciI family protein n=1 Tax=Bacillus sp. FJAT-49736 TaxID=2833582 RepID=UPI001BCA5238|nr:YciI family protein [Bacillus sp. FJAT-49736]MBS4174676.1 YciI family protein [Bacillus sp. FJAT-49736]